MKLLKKLDDNILKILLMLFVFFIPLFPKFPFRVVNYTYIAIRLDDLLTGVLAAVFILQLLRKKVSFAKLPYKKLFGAFWIVVFLSYISGVYITKTVEFPFVGLLHAARRVEYMMLFFIAVSVIRTSTDYKKLLFSFLTSLFLINVYGIGQRFFEFPAISTMNPEFAKGRILFLTPEARLSSTFAGHYDLAAYLVLMLPFLWALFMYAKRIQISQKMKLFTLFVSLLPIVLACYTLTGISTETINHIPIAGTFLSPLNQLVIGTILFALTLYLVLFNKLSKTLTFITIMISTLSLVLTASRTSSIAYIVSTLPYLLYIRKFRYFAIALVLSVAAFSMDKELAIRWAKTVQIRQVIVNEKTGEEVVVQKLKKEEEDDTKKKNKNNKNEKLIKKVDLILDEIAKYTYKCVKNKKCARKLNLSDVIWHNEYYGFKNMDFTDLIDIFLYANKDSYYLLSNNETFLIKKFSSKLNIKSVLDVSYQKKFENGQLLKNRYMKGPQFMYDLIYLSLSLSCNNI
jgi:hypothetical protein